MSLTDEIRVGQTPDQRATAETYGRHNDSARDEIARQMAEFERRNQVNIVPMGATALKMSVQPSIARSIERSHGKGAAAGGAAVQLKAKLKEGKHPWTHEP